MNANYEMRDGNDECRMTNDERMTKPEARRSAGRQSERRHFCRRVGTLPHHADKNVGAPANRSADLRRDSGFVILSSFAIRHSSFLLLLLSLSAAPAAEPIQADVKNVAISGGMSEEKARIVIEADLKGLSGESAKPIFATAIQQSIHASLDKLSQTARLQIDVLQGEPKELALAVSGEGEIRSVTGDRLLDWSVRQEGGARFLVLRPKPADKPGDKAATNFVLTITADAELKALPCAITPLAFASTQPALSQGYIRVESDAGLDVQAGNTTGLVPIEARYLPEDLRPKSTAGALAFRFQGSAYSLPLTLTPADPEARQVVLSNFKLTGQFTDQTAAFTLTATARVKNPQGGALDLLSGGVALTEAASSADWRLRFERDRYVLTFDKAGEFPVQIQFHATVRPADGWSTIDFGVPPSALPSVTFQGLAADTQFRFTGAAKPERRGEDFVSFLPASGAVQLAWKAAKREAEGKLFYSAEMLSHIAVSPGLMRQYAIIEGRVMQGEMTRLVLQMRGAGEVTRVQGEQVLSWNVAPGADAGSRNLVVQFNQPQKEQFVLLVQMQTPLGTFPEAVEPIQLRAEGATRFAGFHRIVNDGAVRLEVVQANGLSQVSPEQFPQIAALQALLPSQAGQRFAYRFSGGEWKLRVQADNVLPELSVSEMLTYHLGEADYTVEAELELEVREAPLRELVVRVPKPFYCSLAILPEGADRTTVPTPDQDYTEDRLIFGKPVLGRHVQRLTFMAKRTPGQTNWALPRIELLKAKAVRGYLAVSAEPGFRVTPTATENLTEIATAFFPKKTAGIQAAFRLSEPAWQATMKVERLPQSIQADVFHLFSIGEGIAYGSSVINYLISGAPVSTLRVDRSAGEYANVEFSGKDIRAWQTNGTGYEIQLHSPVSGAYTLLATYERPFKAKGDTLTFTGVRPLDVQSEQGHTIVVSAYQFDVKPTNVSAGLLALEAAEVPSEYRLFFDAPILAAYRYTARPYNLQLVLSPLAQGETLGQVADRAALTTRISKEGQVITDARYYVKNRGTPHFRLTLPPDTELWSATVNGATVVPVKDAQGNLIPLPPRADPDAVNILEVKLASRSANPARVKVAAPIVAAPVLLAEWTLQPDTGQRLAYRSGSLTPVGGVADPSGFGALEQLFGGWHRGEAWALTVLALLATLASIGLWRWAADAQIWEYAKRRATGAVLGILAFVGAMVALVALAAMAANQAPAVSSTLTFVAPVQQAGCELTAVVDNLPANQPAVTTFGVAWPALLGVIVWLYAALTSKTWLRPVGSALGWTLVAWASLRMSGGAWFFMVCAVFLVAQVAFPAWRSLGKSLTKSSSPPPADGPSAAVVALLLLGLVSFAASAQTAPPTEASPTPAAVRREPPMAEFVTQQIRVADDFVFATAKVRWQARKDQTLPLLFEPAVLTRIVCPTNALRLVPSTVGARRCQVLLAKEAGTFEIELEYQVQVAKKDGASGFTLPTQFGLVNRAALTLDGLDVEVVSPQAVSIQPEATTGSSVLRSNAVFNLVLAPANDAWIGWKPRSRDTRREKAVFYTDMTQLYVPSAGVIEGEHQVQIRPAQGEVSELVFQVPAGLTISDVVDPLATGAAKNKSTRAAIVSVWRFDPDTRKLRVTLNPAQSRPFIVVVQSQVATGPLPFEQSVGLLSVEGAAGQLGLLGVATGSEAQLDSVTATNFSAINLEDFPMALPTRLQSQIAGLTLRRAYRYAEIGGQATLKASPVEPDVRVESQQTLSLGEDRTVLAANLTVEVSRAGIFRLSFVLPAGMDVEAITGAALSHWTELKSAEGRVITLNLNGKTEGKQQFAINLAGPGARATNGWAVPRLVLREASKQRGELLVVPEQGLRLQVATREGVTQLDPQKAGIRQKGVLDFRLLQEQWSLALDLEHVAPWIQVNSLQHVTVNEAQVKTIANLQYQIENTGLKALRVRLPVGADSVRFTGEQVADFRAVEGAMKDGMQEWEVKLHRRVIGNYTLQASFQVPVAEQAKATNIRGVTTEGVNLQRGFLTVQAAGRLQLGVNALPAALQPSEWQSIPSLLRKDIEAAPANFTYRLVEPAYDLPLTFERREATKLLPARVNNITLTSAVSDDGVMLTQVRIEMLPGDKRLLHLTLPNQAKFWFAFVNQNGVWPWLEKDQILIPLEKQAKSDQAITVEFFYSSQIGAPDSRALDLKLLGPKFDLPLENLTWRVFLNEKWRLKDWTGTLQLSEDTAAAQPVTLDVSSYVRGEQARQQQRTEVAHEWLKAGNEMRQQGNQEQARRAFQNALGLSQHDNALNEDARVQLHTLKTEQALVGLNVINRGGQVASGGEAGPAAGKLRELRGRKDANYTQAEAKQIIGATSSEDNAALEKVAERLIQQQDAAVTAPAAIRVAIPEQGRVLTFKRSVQVDTMADMNVNLAVRAAHTASAGGKLLLLFGVFAVLGLLGVAARRISRFQR